MNKSKPFWKSKTFWVNGLMIGATFMGALPVTKTTVIAAGAVNLALRALTDKPVTLIDENR